ncbi:MAG TPA: uroporphyrinogen decarboxylase family protein [Negativicutes bacterium]
MKTNKDLLQERTERLRKAIALEKPDRTPVIPGGDAFHAIQMGVKLSEYCSSVKRSHEIILSSTKEFGDVDATASVCTAAKAYPLTFYANVKLPGRELSDDALWQLDEQEMMTVEDYDTILAKGWASFRLDYLTNRLNVPVASILAELAEVPQFRKNFEDAGYMVYSPCVSLTVTEILGGGRSFSKLMKDLFKLPDKVEAVLDVIQQESLETFGQQIRALKPLIGFVSPARGASQFFSPKLWERFVWKYLKGMVDVIIAEGAAASIHVDGNWERDLEYFKVFPKGKVIIETDGSTDIYKIKKVLGNQFCIKGDVSAALMTLGTPDEVYDYATKLIKDMGPGFILSSGCTLPPNAERENVKALIAAATGK